MTRLSTGLSLPTVMLVSMPNTLGMRPTAVSLGRWFTFRLRLRADAPVMAHMMELALAREFNGVGYSLRIHF